MKVECIRTVIHLTVGRDYSVKEELGNSYLITDDFGNDSKYLKDNFKVLTPLEEESKDRGDELYTSTNTGEVDMTEPVVEMLTGLKSPCRPPEEETIVEVAQERRESLEVLLDVLSYYGALEQNKLIAELMEKLKQGRKDYIKELNESLKQI